MAEKHKSENCNETVSTDELPHKKRKVDAVDQEPGEDKHHHIESFEGFQLVKVLGKDPQTKTIVVHGKYDGKEDEDVVIKLEKTPFTEETIDKLLSSKTSLKLSFQNDIYGQFDGLTDPELNQLKAVVIHPATQRHIIKYTSQDRYMIHETPGDYEKITLPYVRDQQPSLQWVYNILEHKAEADRIVFEDTDPEKGFMLVPDLKWNGKQLDDLYVIAVVQKRGIYSIRDLREEHLDMLKNVQHKGLEAISKKYGVIPSQLRVYLHYQPSYYHLHIHFTSLTYDIGFCTTGKAHLLDEVIDNIENIDGKYYEKKALSYIMRENDPLFLKFKEAGKVNGV